MVKAFADDTIRIPLDEITTLYPVTDAIRASRKYAQIAASIQEIGLIEPIAVSIDPRAPRKYLVVDGHLRLGVMREKGERDPVCLLSSDDEAYTFNKRTSRLAIIQEHKMILRAIELAASEDRIAAALHVKIDHIRRNAASWMESAPMPQSTSRTSMFPSTPSTLSGKWCRSGRSRSLKPWS